MELLFAIGCVFNMIGIFLEKIVDGIMIFFISLYKLLTNNKD